MYDCAVNSLSIAPTQISVLLGVCCCTNRMASGVAIAEVMGYEISKKMTYVSKEVVTPLGVAHEKVLGDKRGRLQVLFGSILLYSLANIANAFVSDISTYAVIRIIAGIGLAGELGAGITLVSEMMSKEKRGYGTMIIVTFGALGAVFASLVGSKGDYFSQMIFNLTNVQLASWQVAYIIGGLMGFTLLFLRILYRI